VAVGERRKISVYFMLQIRVRAPNQLGEEFDGVLSSDDYSAYNGCQSRHKCLAHLRRHFKKWIVGSWQQSNLGASVLDLIDGSLCPHRQWRQTQDTSAYQTWVEGFKSRVQQSIQQWIGLSGLRGWSSRSPRDKAEQWWYFLDEATGATRQ